ncbi:MAG: hypothetical protein ACP5XB_25645 [Isosphaeraceae bacterium]
MNRITAVTALVLGVGLSLGAAARAAMPRIRNISPIGVQRGIAREVTISGANLAGNPRLVAPFTFHADSLDPKRSSAGGWTFKLTVGSDVAVGTYPVRVQTDGGISNPFLLAVGQLPQVMEKEDNSTFEAAQTLPAPPLVVEGQASGNDVDYFKFAGKKGQLIVVDAQCARVGSGVDPSIRLTTASSTRRFVASADDTPGLLTDARLFAPLPEDGDYVVEMSDSRYQGGGRPVYRLLIGAVPAAEEVFPLGGREGETVGFELRGGTLGSLRIAAATLTPLSGTPFHRARFQPAMLDMAHAGTSALDVESLHPLLVGDVPELREPNIPGAHQVRAVAPVVFNGRIDPPGDEDRFVLAVSAEQRLHIAVEASQYGSALDGVLQVQGAKGAVIASADDTNVKIPGQPAGKGTMTLPDPSLELTVPGGTSEITLILRDLEGRGGVGFPYRIVVSPLHPNFELTENEPEISIPKGGTAGLGVTVERKGYDGPITLTVANPPAGLTVRPGTIGPGQKVGSLSLAASPSATFSAAHLRLLGKGQGPDGPIEVEATSELVFAKQGTLPTNTLIQHGLTAAPALSTVVTLEAPGEPIEIAHGFGGTIPVKVTRSKGADAALALKPLPLPPGLIVPAASIAAKASSGSVAVNTGLEAPLGLMTIVLQARGKFADGEEAIAIPAVTLNLVRPAEITLSTAAVEVKPGGTAEVKGKVVRNGAFKEPVTVRLSGLPAGLTADPVTVAPTSSDFTLKIQADAQAAATQVNAQLASAFQVSKKDYPTKALPLAVKVLPAK